MFVVLPPQKILLFVRFLQLVQHVQFPGRPLQMCTMPRDQGFSVSPYLSLIFQPSFCASRKGKCQPICFEGTLRSQSVPLHSSHLALETTALKLNLLLPQPRATLPQVLENRSSCLGTVPTLLQYKCRTMPIQDKPSLLCIGIGVRVRVITL